MRQFLIAGMLAAAIAVPAFAAGSEAGYKAALAAAEKAEQEAGALKNQWTTTNQALTAAKKEATAGNFEKATELAKHAEALASASIGQANEQKKLWKNATLR